MSVYPWIPGVPVYPWIPGVPVCPYGCGFLVCPEAREETYLHIDVIFFYPTLRFFLHFNMDFFSLERHVIFRYLNFQKWFENDVFYLF